ncbi:hypothetical protein GCM10027203_13670 [Nonomuraea fastidiosa]
MADHVQSLTRGLAAISPQHTTLPSPRALPAVPPWRRAPAASPASGACAGAGEPSAGMTKPAPHVWRGAGWNRPLTAPDAAGAHRRWDAGVSSAGAARGGAEVRG